MTLWIVESNIVLQTKTVFEKVKCYVEWMINGDVTGEKRMKTR